MVKRIKKVTKSKATRERKKIIIVGTEGDNQTEIQYLRSLEKRQKQYHFIFAPGRDTDPIGILRNTIRKADDEEISPRTGDLAVSIFDLDLDRTKIPQLSDAKRLAEKKGISIITSNPCFEIWYLEHFGYTSRSFNSSAELLQVLKKYIPDYQKSYCDITVLYPLTDEAISNCKRLDEHHKKNGTETVFEFSNPRTDMYILIEQILQEGKKS